ncbi:MAG TPA: GDSL-type esterase/lipase family protein, partial [Glaciihabitans sp.]|nr:GDSL-type esterase/lipase family protein [Glaciihabitans sp.]
LAASVHGALEIQEHPNGICPTRLPAWTRAQHADGGMERMSSQTSGVRIRLVTAAQNIHLEATFTRTASSTHPARPLRVVAESPRAHHSISVDEGDILVESPDRTAIRQRGERSQLDFVLDSPNEERSVTLWLPHSAASNLHRLTADAPLRPAASERIRWLHYGSSISHGSDLDDPRSPWPQQVARKLQFDLVNLGFAGNAMLDPFVAGAIAAAPADFISLKIGINLVNGDAMRARTFVPAVHGFLDRVRAGHPTVPIAVISALACPIHEHTTGPTRESSPGKAGATFREIRAGDGSLTLTRTRELLASTVEMRADPALHFVNGLDLLGTDDGHLPDNLHPDTDGHTMIAARFAPIVRSLLHLTD